MSASPYLADPTSRPSVRASLLNSCPTALPQGPKLPRSAVLFLVALLGCLPLRAQQNSGDRFWIIASKNENGSGWTAMGNPTVNDNGNVVVCVQAGGQYQLRVFLNDDQLYEAANSGLQGMTTSYQVRQSPFLEDSFPVIANNQSVVSYVISPAGYQLIERCDRLAGTDTWTNPTIAAAEPGGGVWPFWQLSPIAGIDSASPPNIYFYAEWQPLYGPYTSGVYSSSANVAEPASLTPIASNPGAFSYLGLYVASSANGNVVFSGAHPTLGTGIFRWRPGQASVVAVATDKTFHATGARPGINSPNTVAFAGVYGNGSAGVFLLLPNDTFPRAAGNPSASPSPQVPLPPYGDVPTAYDTFNRTLLNDFNQVAFLATDRQNRQAIYSTCLGRLRRVISAGDTLSYLGSSSTVTSLGLFNGLGTNGQIVFHASMQNGDEVLVRANRAFNQRTTLYSPIIPSYYTIQYLLLSVPGSGFPNQKHPRKTIGQEGCNLTSTVNLLNCYGVAASPFDFQNWLICKWTSPPPNRDKWDYINPDNDFDDGIVEEYSKSLIARGMAGSLIHFVDTHSINHGSNLGAIISELRAGRPVKIRVPSGGGPWGHFIMAYGLIDPSKPDGAIGSGDILIADPGKNPDFTLADYGKLGGTPDYDTKFAHWLENEDPPPRPHRRVYLYSSVPERTLHVSGYSPVDLVVTDSLGRRAGCSDATGMLTEIPGSDYFEELPYYTLEDDATAGVPAWDPDDPVKHVIVAGVTNGAFTLDLYGTTNGAFTLTMIGNGGCVCSPGAISGTVNPGDHLTYTFIVTSVMPEILLPLTQSDGSINCTVVGDPTIPLLVQASTNLVDWALLPGAQFTNGTGVVTVSTTNRPALFLRAVQ